ncbi:hypothetical protein FQN50_004087 [Emmonsiellopsis sp. PD_5]|nr:hypothetical protein FQN50_004087 [Emmonsiellopsis sp. PD_5]
MNFYVRLANIPDLQPIAAGTGSPLVVQSPITSAVWTADESTSHQLNAKCQDFVTRYLRNSLISCAPDDPNVIHVNRKLFELTFAYPCLMHASLAVALTYDRYLNGSLGCRRSLEECYHWSQGTALLNRRLNGPIEGKDKDPIWGTAAALALLSFASPDACTPEESWPLNSSDDSPLGWLRIINGKMALWHIVNPLRPDSLFHVMAGTFAQMNSPLPERGIDGIPSALAAMCFLEESSTANNNPYFDAAHAVCQILVLPDNKVTTGQTQLFTRSIHGPFEDLLRKRDPVALLLLYLWYRKAGRSIWWIQLRARVECPSICLYLQLYHRENVTVQQFLPGGALVNRWN